MSRGHILHPIFSVDSPTIVYVMVHSSKNPSTIGPVFSLRIDAKSLMESGGTPELTLDFE